MPVGLKRAPPFGEGYGRTVIQHGTYSRHDKASYLILR